MALKISISGVRGIVPETLTTEVCLDFAKAFGTYLLENGHPASPKIVIGCDPRASSESIKKIVFSGLLSCGCEVIDLGICPTPTVGIMVRELKAAGGMVITASHNPLPWNGLKFIREDGIFLNEDQANQLIEIYHAKNFKKGKPGSTISNSSAIDIHIEKILKTVSYFPALVSGTPIFQEGEICEGRWLKFEMAMKILTFSEGRALFNGVLHELKTVFHKKT